MKKTPQKHSQKADEKTDALVGRIQRYSELKAIDNVKAELDELARLVAACGGTTADTEVISAMCQTMYSAEELFGKRAKQVCPLWASVQRNNRMKAFRSLLDASKAIQDHIKAEDDTHKMQGTEFLTKIKVEPNMLRIFLGTATRADACIRKEVDKELDDMTKKMHKRKVEAESVLSGCPAPTEPFVEFIKYMKLHTGAKGLSGIKSDLDAMVDKVDQTKQSLCFNNEDVMELGCGKALIEMADDSKEMCAEIVLHVTMFALATVISHDDIRKPQPGKVYRG